MAPLDPRSPDTWSQWATQWSEAQRQWLDWWQRSLGGPATSSPPEASPATSPSPGSSASPAGPAPVEGSTSSASAAACVFPALSAFAGLSAPAISPAAMTAASEQFRDRLAALWQAVLELPATGGALPEVAAATDDRRFRNDAWHRQPYFSFLRQAYLIYAHYLRELAAAATLPPREKQKLVFTIRQYLDAMAPTNFAATNPEVVQRAIATEGESLVRGLLNLADDARKGRISMTDEAAFEVGRNIAVTPGSVVYRNELIEIIQYTATTPTVCKRPLVMVPPCINKYYILDLGASNSFVAHAVAQGHTVFMLSWRNVPPELGKLTWDDYVEKGALTALRVASEIAGSKTVNALGFCVGGAILACALGVLAARRDHSVASATLLTTLVDYADPGEIGVYVSREFLAAREAQLMAGQVVNGGELAGAFASLRANELVWNYVVGNYLKGQTPPAFDLLYWNSDSTNLPGPMYAYYLRNLYLDNKLRLPGALEMAGESIDLSQVHAPAYIYASHEDHIVPWRSAYRTTGLLGGDVTFVLGASGHIAGVVNPPEAGKRNYWVNDLLADKPEDWFARAKSVAGSWWPHWYAWLAPHGGARHAAPLHEGSAQHPVLGPAPGEYVRAKA